MFRSLLIAGSAALITATAFAAAPARAVRVSETSSSLRFLYSYPARAAAIPGLRALLAADAREKLAESRRDSRADGRASRTGPDEFEQQWSVSADTPRLLALESIESGYQDGAPHGYFAYRSLIWSRTEQRRLDLKELFVDRRTGPPKLMAALCTVLNRARADRWRAEGNAAPPPMGCPDADETAVSLVGGRNGRIRAFRLKLNGDQTPDGYAGGSYEVEVPVTPALSALVKPALRSSF